MIVNDYFFNRGGQNYEAPSVTIFDIQSEGVLCGSFDENNYTEKFNIMDMEEL